MASQQEPSLSCLRIGADENVTKCEAFSHTIMTDEQTERFLEDHTSLPQNEIHEKWQQYAVNANAETDLFHGLGGAPSEYSTLLRLDYGGRVGLRNSWCDCGQ